MRESGVGVIGTHCCGVACRRKIAGQKADLLVIWAFDLAACCGETPGGRPR